VNISEARNIIVQFIADYVGNSGADGLVVGLSGGLDSSVSAALAVEAIGAERILAVILPCGSTDPKSVEDAKKIAKHLGLEFVIYDIVEAVDVIASACDATDNRIRYGNIAARVRMIHLYDISAELNRLVLGTGNRTEALLGYTTLWGDMACAFTPLGGLLKTQERRLAEEIGLPKWIIEKAPSAGLWRGQTDEGELGITYEMADKILYAIFDLNKIPNELVAEGFPQESVELVLRLYQKSSFKRRMPVYPELQGLPL